MKEYESALKAVEGFMDTVALIEEYEERNELIRHEYKYIIKEILELKKPKEQDVLDILYKYMS